MDFHFGRRLLVLGFVVALIAGTAQIASAIEIQDNPEIQLIFNEEQPGHPGNSWLGDPLISIGDTIEVRAVVTPPESVDYVIANLCAYGGGTHDTLYHDPGHIGEMTEPEWVPTCSDGGGASALINWSLVDEWSPELVDETWRVLWNGANDWIVWGSYHLQLAAHATTGTPYYAVVAGDTLFTFTITSASGLCCDTYPTTCDHWEFETHPALQPSDDYVLRFVVGDGGDCWIDHNPCWYEGHWDARVQVVACDVSVAFCDTSMSWWPGIVNDGDGGWEGDSIWVDTHWTKYAQLEDPAGYAAEFLEHEHYFFDFDFDNSGLGPIFGLTDTILNPASGCFDLNPDVLCANVDMGKLAHENGNDDIDSLYFDLSAIGDAWADPATAPTGDVNDNGFWFVGNPGYSRVRCTLPVYNGWATHGVYRLCWNILPGQTDSDAGVEYITMYWISDSGDTTFFPEPTNKLASIDNIIPALTDASESEPRDSVTTDDFSFRVDMDNAGDPGFLNPVSVGNDIADWLQVMLDLAGLYDLDDVVNGGQAWADMRGIGVYYYEGAAPAPMGWGYVRPMGEPPVLAPVWETEETDVVASPPSPYDWDQDSILTGAWIFDNAGNAFCLGPATGDYPIDNIPPIVTNCDEGPYIYVGWGADEAFRTGYANVGAPLNMECNGTYSFRDQIVLHANLADALGFDEVGDVQYVTDIYDPFCVGGITLYDNGLLGHDPVTGDRNWTGHARLEVAHTTRGVPPYDTTFCAVDSDEDSLGFEVLVTDDAGNAWINASCQGLRVDNEPQTMSADQVAMFFYDDPETIELDGDVNGDGIVNTGDLLIFEWRIEDETWDDMEIPMGQVMVDLSSIDPAWVGTLGLIRLPSGGIFRNYYPDGPADTHPFEVPSGTVDGEELKANFTNYDNAGNTPGWCEFASGLILDDLGPSIDCDSFTVTVDGPDEIASIGETVHFKYSGPDEDVVAIGVWVGGINSDMDTLWLVLDDDHWDGYVVVTEGSLDTDNYIVDAWAVDDVGNKAYYKGCVGPFSIDNEPPEMACQNAWLRLWDYNDNVTSPTRVVNVGDNLTAVYWDETDDVVRVTADFSNYYDTETVYEMVAGFMFGPATRWGYRVDPVPDGTIDEPAGGLHTKVLMTAWDDAGNVTSDWFCPMWYNEGMTYTDTWLHNNNGLCSSCLPVDTKRPAAVPPDAITFELLDDIENEIANVGDRLRVIVNMGDPTAPGYDMEWASAFVQADIGQYGDDYDCADMDACDYLFLTDDGYSAGGEGDGRFSYFFWFNEDDGPTLFEGAPILPGMTELPAGDEGTKIRVRAMDDAGNWSLDWTWSDVLVLENTTTPVPVDNYIPVVDPEDIAVTYVDNDYNGICDIGDEVTVTVDMTDAPGGPATGVYADLYDWGHESQDMVPLIPGSPIYSITFTALANPGDYCGTQPDGAVGFEDDAASFNCGKVEALVKTPAPIVNVVAKDASDNWSAYEWAHGPSDVTLLASGPTPVYVPMVAAWPFVWDWISSYDLTDMLVDTDAPDPVNPTFPYPSIPASGVQSEPLQDGRIGIQLFYKTSPRNMDVKEFYVFGDISGTEPGTINWEDFLGEPIPAGTVPTTVTLGGNYEWISDALDEREEPYHFAVLAVDNAGNWSDKDLTWITGISSDATAPTGYIEAAFTENLPCVGDNQPTSIGGGNVNFIGRLDQASEYINVVYIELFGRVKDLDPVTEGYQPGLWTRLGDHGQWPSSETHEGPYVFPDTVLPAAFDITHCETFELVLVPWDEAGNHLTPDECAIFEYTYDPFDPVVTMFAINGNPSPYDMELANSALVEITATDECDMTGELTYWLYISQMGDQSFGQDWPLLTRQTLAVGQPFSYPWDLANYPAGHARLELYVCDDAGHYTTHFKRVVVIDQAAPTGVFASYRRIAELFSEGSHPYYTRLLDGQSIGGDEYTRTWFWTEWPDPIPFTSYDVDYVKMEYQMAGSLDGWTTIGIETAYDDTVSWEGSEWAGYEFMWDTRGFSDGDQVTLRATVMDNVGNETVQTVTVTVAADAPILALTIPEAQEVCGENRIKGIFNIIGTEITNPIDTYYVSYIIKSHDYPDLGDCNPLDTDGWIWAADTLMMEGGTTQETIWRGKVNPDSAFMGIDFQLPVYGMPDGAYDIALVTTDVAGNWSWDKNDDWCVDAGYFGWAVANGMGMTVVLQNEAPEVRIRTVNAFGSVDEPWPWPQPVYVQAGDAVTVTSWTESTCDVAKVEYWLADTDTSNHVVLDGMRLVGVSTSPDDYAATFPSSGGVGQYLVPGALQHGYVVVDLIAKLTDVLGNESFFYAPMWILDISPASVMITNPAPGAYVRHEVALESDALADDEIYSVTYYYRAVGSGTWIPIATTMPHDGDKWNTDTNGNTIYWNTDLLPAGCNQYELAAIAKDADLVDDPEPPVIRVYVDNTAPDVTLGAPAPMYVNGTASWIGGPRVELTATASDACGIRYVRFWEKLAEEHYEDADMLVQDAEAPWAYTWEGSSFTSKLSGWYNLIAEAEDMAGNVTYSAVTVYIDQWAPEGWITQINTDATPDGSNFNGVLAITGWCKDDVPMNQVANQKYDSGLAGAQFQYRNHVVNGTDLPLSSGREEAWTDLGGVVTGSGPNYTINWDTGTLVPGTYDVRIVGIDHVNNRADVDGTPMLAYVTICIVDMAAPKAIIAGVDKTSGTIWATTETHGQNDISFVRFEYKPASALETAAWTEIGVVDSAQSCSGLYGTLWHYAALANGNYLVRAVAYDDDYDVDEFPDLYDKTPATMMVTINNTAFEVIMAPTAQITSLDRWGNLDDYDELMAKAVTTSASVKPTVIVVYDNDPEDHYNTPWAKQLELERPDDQTVWVDGFSTGAIGDWGIVTVIGTYNNAGVVGAKTSILKVYRVTDREGTKGPVSQDGMSVTLQPGATYHPSEGLMIVKIQQPVADLEIDDIVPVGQTVMMKYVDHEGDVEFTNGLKARVVLDYTPGMIPAGVAEAKLRVAHWCGGDREWDTWGIDSVTVDETNNRVSFFTTHSGAYAVVAGSGLRITAPVYLPGCGGYTGRWPQMFSTIEDILFEVDRHDILVVLDGPAGNKFFDNVRIFDNGHAADGIEADYDCVSNNLYIGLDPSYDWEGEYPWLADTWDGLPAGQYTLTITAMNTFGDKKTITNTFIVDAVKPTVGYAGTYVAPNPSFVVNVHDTQSGIDPETIFLDVYATGYGYLGTATPAGMTYDEEAGTVTFDQMIFDRTLGDGQSFDIIVYDADVPFSDCTDYVSVDGCGYCRSYCPDQGIADCAGNRTNPVWRRYTVDGVPPTATLVDTLFASADGDCGGEITVAIRDVTAGINPSRAAFKVWVNGAEMDSTDLTFEPTDVSGGIIHGGDLTFAVDCICAGITEMEIKVKSVDMVGNYRVITDEVRFVCEKEELTAADLLSYPNPFDPYAGEKATISIDLSKAADLTVKIFDFAGEPVRTLKLDDAGPGLVEEIQWDGTDESGNMVATGAYIANVRIDDGQKVISKNLKIGVAKRSND